MKEKIFKFVRLPAFVVIALCLIVTGCIYGLGQIGEAFSGGEPDVVIENVENYNITYSGSEGLGAYIDEGQVTTFTDVNITNDLVVDGECRANALIAGGSVTTLGTTSVDNLQLTAANICDNSVIQADSGTASTLYIASTTELFADCLTTNGDTKSFFLRNTATTTGVFTITASSTSGISRDDDQVLLEQNAGGVVVIDDDEYARITLTRITSVTTTIDVDAYFNAD